MDNVVLKATRRSVTGKQVKALRRQGQLPAVMYGHNMEPVSILLDEHSTTITLTGLSSSTIVTIELEGNQHAALVRERQRDYLKNRLLHIDFQVVSLTEKLRTSVSIVLTGTAPAVKDQNAVIVTNVSNVEVEALPGDLPEHLSLDISKLESVGDTLYVRDIQVPNGVEILTSGDEVVVVATSAAPDVEELGTEGELAEPEVIERGKKEEDED